MPLASKHTWVSDIASSLEPNLFPWSILLKSENSQQTLGARYGEKGCCGSNSSSFAIVAIDLWHVTLSWRNSTFFFFICGHFWRFPPSNAPVMLYNFRYWWFFFFSQGNHRIKYVAYPEIRKPKLCLLMFAPLVVLDSGVKWWIHCHIYAKTSFCFIETDANTTLWIVDDLLFLIDCKQTQQIFWRQLSHWQMFMQNDEYTAFWYLQLLFYLTQLQFTID